MTDLDPIRRLKEIAHDLQQIPIQRVTEHEKVFFICINTYKSYNLNLGKGPIADAYALARILKMHGYPVYYLHNPHSLIFLEYFDKFLATTQQHLIFMYVGRGTGVEDLNGDEVDGIDEALVFDDGNLIDDDLVTHLEQNKNRDNVLTLLTDARYKTPIWDMAEKARNGNSIPPNVRSLSAETRYETTILTPEAMMRNEQGAFADGIARVLRTNPKATPREIQELIKPSLAQEGQVYSMSATSEELLDQPVLL